MTKYTDTFTVKNFHTGPNGLAYIPSLFHFMYEAAGDHCIEEKITVQDLQKIGLTWMLSRMNVEISRIPALRDELTVITWPTGTQGLFSCRDFLMTDQNSKEVARATSAWLTINLEKRRVVRLPQIVLDIHPESEIAERMIIDNFKGRLEEPVEGEVVDGFRADYSTLDVNSHVTSAVYIRWILDALPFDFHIEKKLKKFEIIHKIEILPGGEAQAEYEINGNEIIHCIRPSGGGAVNCVAKSLWE
ncbi:MAG TPA: hypothetical protein DCO79_09455 [Spirochaeta sp.]|nr:hypothetical protein [Spirochaeta sp.]